MALSLLFFFFNDTATTEIYTLSLHDALPISRCGSMLWIRSEVDNIVGAPGRRYLRSQVPRPDRKSTRLNSSHSQISYAVFCLKKKNNADALGVILRAQHRKPQLAARDCHHTS